jgi:hypothetical protein
MLKADRQRARIAYRGLTDYMSDARERATIERNRATPEYREADERYRKYSAIVGDDGPEDLKAMFRLG